MEVCCGLVADQDENPRFLPLSGDSDGDVLYVREAIIEVNLLAPFATSGGNPRSVDRMMVVLLRHYPLGGIIHVVLQWMKGTVDGIGGGGGVPPRYGVVLRLLHQHP
jgi:hypothetical protein